MKKNDVEKNTLGIRTFLREKISCRSRVLGLRTQEISKKKVNEEIHVKKKKMKFIEVYRYTLITF